KQARVINFRAAIHHNLDPCAQRPLGGLVIDDAELYPDELGANGNRILDDGRQILGTTEDVDHIDRLWNIAQRGVTFLTENFTRVRIDGDDAVAQILQVFSNVVARPLRTWRAADHGNSSHGFEQALEIGIGCNQ